MSDAPQSYGIAGQQLWDSIVPAYSLRPDELRILGDACAEADIIADLEAARRSSELTTKGSMGQEVISPYISELRAHRTVMSGLLKSLKLPDSPAGAAQKRAKTSEQARAAARARWGTGQGA